MTVNPTRMSAITGEAWPPLSDRMLPSMNIVSGTRETILFDDCLQTSDIFRRPFIPTFFFQSNDSIWHLGTLNKADVDGKQRRNENKRKKRTAIQIEFAS